MKKVMIGILVTLMMLIPFSTAFADGTATTPTPTTKQLNADKKAAREKVKEALAAKRVALKLQYATNQALRDQIKASHVSIKASLVELRKQKTSDSKAKIAQVKTALANLAANKSTLVGLRDDGIPFWNDFKVNVKALNIEAALGNLNSIAGVKNSRSEQLTIINTTLNSIKTILAQQ